MITKDVLLIVILALHATAFATSPNGDDGTSFLVIADMHSMSEFAFEDQWPSDSNYLQQTWNDLTSIVENIKQLVTISLVAFLTITLRGANDFQIISNST